MGPGGKMAATAECDVVMAATEPELLEDEDAKREAESFKEQGNAYYAKKDYNEAYNYYTKANVNNWHWTERDATIWSKGKLRELLVGIAMENEAGRCEISELKQVEGEASCNSRKGKLIFFYEWNIKLAWKGTVKESGAKHKGLIEIPSLSEENEINDTEVSAGARTKLSTVEEQREPLNTEPSLMCPTL